MHPIDAYARDIALILIGGGAVTLAYSIWIQVRGWFEVTPPDHEGDFSRWMDQAIQVWKDAKRIEKEYDQRQAFRAYFTGRAPSPAILHPLLKDKK